jgi:hypothetical protein
MALKIDPTKIHLGDTQHKYYAEYLPAYTEQVEKPEICLLPPLTTLTLTPVTFSEIAEVCVFTFPDVTPIPPVYNPPVIPGGCVDFIAESTFTIGSPLSGGLTLTPTGPPNCGLTVGGEINLSLEDSFCTEVTASSNVTGTGTASPSVALSLISLGCGISLTGTIGVDACKQVTGAINVTGTGKASPTVNLNLTSANDGCGFSIGGSIGVDACKTLAISTTAGNSATINFTQGVTSLGSVTIGGTLISTPASDGCGSSLRLNLSPTSGTINIPPVQAGADTIAGLYLTTGSGGGGGTTISLAGQLETSCLSDSLELSTLDVNLINAPPPPCCPTPGSFLNLCEGILTLVSGEKVVTISADTLREGDVAKFRPVTATVDGQSGVIYVLTTGKSGTGAANVTITTGGGGGGTACYFSVTDATAEDGTLFVQVSKNTIAGKWPVGMGPGGDPFKLIISQSCYIYAAILWDTVNLVVSSTAQAITILQSNNLLTNTSSLQYVLLATVTVANDAIVDISSNTCTEPVPDPCTLAWSSGGGGGTGGGGDTGGGDTGGTGGDGTV